MRTTNPGESLFAAVTLRTDVTKRFKKVTNATPVIWKTLMLVDQRFQKSNSTEKMEQVFLGIQFKDGIEIKREEVLAVVCHLDTY